MAQRILGDYRQIRRQVSLRAALRQYAPAEKAAAICVAASSHFSKLLHSSPGKEENYRTGTELRKVVVVVSTLLYYCEKGHYLWDLTRFLPR